MPSAVPDEAPESSGRFDGARLHVALDARRASEDLSWAAVARQVWDLSAGLNARRPSDHPFGTSAIESLRTRGTTSCQHALLLIWWLGCTPEDFVPDAVPGTAGTPLPACDEEHRLRWSLRRVHGTLNAARTARGATWAQTARRLGCTPSQLTGLATARYGTNMVLAMSITQALRRPAADFVYAADW